MQQASIDLAAAVMSQATGIFTDMSALFAIPLGLAAVGLLLYLTVRALRG